MRAAVQVRGSVDLEGVLRVIDCAYAAACDETSWDRFVAEVVRLGGFGGCALGSIDPLAPRPVLRAAYGLRDLAPTGSETNRMPRNPLLTDEVLRSPPGTLWHDRQVIAPPLLAATRFAAYSTHCDVPPEMVESQTLKGIVRVEPAELPY